MLLCTRDGGGGGGGNSPITKGPCARPPDLANRGGGAIFSTPENGVRDLAQQTEGPSATEQPCHLRLVPFVL